MRQPKYSAQIGKCSLLILAILCGPGARSVRGAEEDQKEVKTIAAEVKATAARAGVLPLSMHVLGKINPPRQMPASVNALAAGVVTRINVHDGQQVSTGTLLLTLDGRATQAALQKAKSDMALAEKELSYAEKSGLLQEQEDLDLAATQARVRAQQALKESERTAALLAKALVSEKAATEARQAAETSQKEVAAAERKAAVFHQSGQGLELDRLKAKLAEAQAALRLSELDMEATIVKAPVTGRVTRLHALMGQTVEKGAPLVEMEASQGIGVSFALPPHLASQVRPSMSFSLADDQTTRTYEGVIASVGGGVDPDSGLVRVDGLLDGKNATHPFLGEILPGTITKGMSPRGLIVPLSALSVTDEGILVHIIDAKHQAHPKTVEVLAQTAEEAVIKTEEVKAGQKVVAEGNYNLPDGAQVEEKDEALAADKDEKAGDPAKEKEAPEPEPGEKGAAAKDTFGKDAPKKEEPKTAPVAAKAK